MSIPAKANALWGQSLLILDGCESIGNMVCASYLFALKSMPAGGTNRGYPWGKELGVP